MSALEKSTSKAAKQDCRLSKNVVPSYYRLELEPDLVDFCFSGRVQIALELKEAAKQIVLHAAELEIDKAVFKNAEHCLAGKTSLDQSRQLAIVELEATAEAGVWELDLAFRGKLNDKLRGFYRSSYKDQQGQEKFIAVSKFEPSDARRAFPCFDEPEFKAVFEISLIVPPDLEAVSNSPLSRQSEHVSGKKQLHFSATIKMSTYLVAFVVGDLSASEPVFSRDGKPIRIWSQKGKQHLVDFGLAWAKNSLDYFADYFGIEYPGQKLDLVAIPDFASGAMENFGCITFRETALLVDTETATQQELKRVAEVISHENAHMWFGDLVTMSWWNGLWLNEAFATFMAAKALDELAPQWRFWDSFNIEKSAAMRVDGLAASRSIEFPVESPEDARAMFDVLTYEKGCAILRMLELYMGADLFRRGCSIYMNRHAYANTETGDLWQALQEAASDAGRAINVPEMMDAWVYQMGYPLIYIEQDADSSGFTLKQEPFRFLTQSQADIQSCLWTVPVSFRVLDSSSSKPQYLELSSKNEKFTIENVAQPLLLNAGAAGFFRTAYSPELRASIFNRLDLLTASERFNLLSDLWAATQSGALSLAAYINALRMLLAQETDLNVFSLAASSLTFLRRLLVIKHGKLPSAFSKFAGDLFGPSMTKLGWSTAPSELSQDSELRGVLAACLALSGVESVKLHLHELWLKYRQDRKSVDSNLLPAIVENLAAYGDADSYAELEAARESALTPQEESRFLNSLTLFQDANLIQKSIELSLSEKLRNQDKPLFLRSLLLNPKASEACWLHLKSNWQLMIQTLPLQGVIRVLDGIPGLAGTEPSYKEIAGFLAEQAPDGTQKALAQNLELLLVAIEFLKREKVDMERIFAD